MKTINYLKNGINIIGIAIYFQIATSSCNSGTAQSNNVPSESIESEGVEAQVVIEDKAYNPSTITVEKGTKVTWTDNQSLMPHTVTSDMKGLFDSGNLHKKDTFSFIFNDAGTYTYYCKHHKDMHGTVIVK